MKFPWEPVFGLSHRTLYIGLQFYYSMCSAIRINHSMLVAITFVLRSLAEASVTRDGDRRNRRPHFYARLQQQQQEIDIATLERRKKKNEWWPRKQTSGSTSTFYALLIVDVCTLFLRYRTYQKIFKRPFEVPWPRGHEKLFVIRGSFVLDSFQKCFFGIQMKWFHFIVWRKSFSYVSQKVFSSFGEKEWQ